MRIILAIFLFGQVIMGTQLDFLEIKGVKVPLIY
jgi:hypothetical protein